jgi:hypothetical protein
MGTEERQFSCRPSVPFLYGAARGQKGHGGEKYTIFIENEYSRERDGAGAAAASFFVYFLAKGVAFLSSLAYNEGYSIAALPQNKK